MQTLSIGKKKRIYAIAFSPSGEQMAAACGDGHLHIWDLNKQSIVRSAPIRETSCGYTLAFLDNDRLAFGGTDLSWWDLKADGWNLIAPGYPWGRRIKVSSDARYLAEVDQMRSADWPGQGLVIRETEQWQRLPLFEEETHTTGGLAFSPDRRLLATGHLRVLGQKERHINSLVGRFDFEVNDYDYLVYVREMPSGRIIQTVAGWQQPVTNLAFSPDNTFLAGTAGIRLRAWNLAADREAGVHKRGPKHFQGLSFTADGQFVATVSNDETVRIWDAHSWQERSTFTWKIGQLLNIAFAPDGLRAAAGSDKGQIVIWDVD
jgi:WD40 repeat protein